VSVPCPEREQRRALQQEKTAMLRLRQSVEQALVGVAREQELKVVATSLRELKEPCTDGRAYVLARFIHASASR
jgi:hypothetical protein